MQCVLVLNAVRFDAKCSAFWCKMQCVLVLIAVQKQAFWPAFFCYCGCKFGIIFLQREMQKHSKWQKDEEKSTRCCPPFLSFGCILYRFSRYFFLEWFAKKTRFVKDVYRFNKSFTYLFQDKKTHRTAIYWHGR